ncbi:hypothetical protein NQ314_011239 [Rhamnusium bicolor]|uniref:Endoplasmic reticulum metallopeptidase 1-like C-terminal domain-containing protein n=1 Tax=Rhamnusium bicolor TaxID=1586634 RepID=A0AAV8XK74_9CUCU|nr:hypothetical protein NQ314_011239 [Rhamnusium bicolor]
MTKAELVTQDCEDHLYCGLPYLVPVLTMIWKTHWLPGPAPKLLVPAKMQVISREKINEGERITMRIEGPAHIGVMISPVSGVQLEKWSLKTHKLLAGPLWNGRDTYFIYYAYGLDPVPLVFSMDFKIPPNHSGPVMDFAVNSHYLFGPGKTSEDLNNLINQFPSWTAVTFWTASYESWIL